MKLCKLCKQDLPYSFFSKKSSAKDGYFSRCKNCESQVKRKRYAENKEQILEQCKRSYQKHRESRLKQKKEYSLKNKNETSARKKKDRKINPLKSLLREAKSRAKVKNLEFNLTIEDLILPTFCPILGIKLEVSNEKFSDNSPSLDRIDNSKGYVAGNVWVISLLANQMKRTATREQLIAFGKWAVSLEN